MAASQKPGFSRIGWLRVVTAVRVALSRREHFGNEGILLPDQRRGQALVEGWKPSFPGLFHASGNTATGRLSVAPP